MNLVRSRLLGKINFETVKRIFNVSEGLKTKKFSEEECNNLYEETDDEHKFQFLSKFLKIEQAIHETPLPYHVKIF